MTSRPSIPSSFKATPPSSNNALGNTGVNPIPASSGNTVRHRLNRGGDRSLNSALHMVAIVKMTHDHETRDYVEKRRAEGRTDKEIRRCIKRYLSRRIYRALNASATRMNAA